MRFIIVALALMAMFSTASETTTGEVSTTGAPATLPEGWTETAEGWCTGTKAGNYDIQPTASADSLGQCYTLCAAIADYDLKAVEYNLWGECFCMNECLCWTSDAASTTWSLNAPPTTQSCDTYNFPGQFKLNIGIHESSCEADPIMMFPTTIFFGLCSEGEMYKCNKDKTITYEKYTSATCEGTPTETSVIANGDCTIEEEIPFSVSYTEDCTLIAGFKSLSVGILFAFVLAMF